MDELKLKYGLVPNKEMTSENQSNISTTINYNYNYNSNSNSINTNSTEINNPNNFMKKIDII